MIYKLKREATAELIIKRLPRFWNNFNHLVIQLRNTERTYSTFELWDLRNSFISYYTNMNNFNTEHGTWFASRYPEFATALNGILASLQIINSIIVDGLQNNYWDAELDAPVITNIAQNHRNSLATSIEAELET